MTETQAQAIEQFFAAVDLLKSLKVVRSDKYLGDIAEFICKDQFGLELAASGRQPGHDGHIGDLKVQVKFGGGSSTTIDCGHPEQYDELLIVLGPKSVLRGEGKPKGFIVYRIPSAVVVRKTPHADGKRRYTRGQLPHEYRAFPTK
jgi:hypothetical protein